MFFLAALLWDTQLSKDAESHLGDKKEVISVFIDNTPFHLNTKLIHFPFPLCCRTELDKTVGNSSNESQVYMALSTQRIKTDTEMDLQPRRGVDAQMDGNVVSPCPLYQIYEYLGSMREWGGMGKR